MKVTGLQVFHNQNLAMHFIKLKKKLYLSNHTSLTKVQRLTNPQITNNKKMNAHIKNISFFILSASTRSYNYIFFYFTVTFLQTMLYNLQTNLYHWCITLKLSTKKKNREMYNVIISKNHLLPAVTPLTETFGSHMTISCWTDQFYSMNDLSIYKYPKLHQHQQ